MNSCVGYVMHCESERVCLCACVCVCVGMRVSVCVCVCVSGQQRNNQRVKPLLTDKKNGFAFADASCG